MKKMIVVIAAMLMFAGVAHAGCGCGQRSGANLGKEVASTVTDTGKSAAEGTAKVVEDTATNTVQAPTTAIQATKDTAATALERADKAIKTFTGQED